MGVTGLWRLIEASGKAVPLETLEDKVLAIDISIWIHQMLQGYQDKRGHAMPNAHLLGLYTRICKLLYFKIKPVFVFDGGVPLLKKNTIASRKKLKAISAAKADQLKSDLLHNLMKHSLVKEVLLKNQIEPSTSNDAPKKLSKPTGPDLFELPTLPTVGEEDSTSSDSSFSEKENKLSPRNQSKWRGNIHNVNVETDDFKSLPADVRYDILSDLKETRKQNSWGRMHEMPSESTEFASFQLSRLLKRRKVQEFLEEAEKEMGGKNLTLDQLEQMLSDQGVDLGTKDTAYRIAADDSTRLVYVSDVKALKSGTSGGFLTSDDVEMIPLEGEEPGTSKKSISDENNQIPLEGHSSEVSKGQYISEKSIKISENEGLDSENHVTLEGKQSELSEEGIPIDIIRKNNTLNEGNYVPPEGQLANPSKEIISDDKLNEIGNLNNKSGVPSEKQHLDLSDKQFSVERSSKLSDNDDLEDTNRVSLEGVLTKPLIEQISNSKSKEINNVIEENHSNMSEKQIPVDNSDELTENDGLDEGYLGTLVDNLNDYVFDEDLEDIEVATTPVDSPLVKKFFGQTKVNPALAYMIEYSGLSQEQIAAVIEDTRQKDTNKSSKSYQQLIIEKRSENSEQTVGVISDSDSDDFVEVQDVLIPTEKEAMEIVIDSKGKLDDSDDIFADVFTSDGKNTSLVPASEDEAESGVGTSVSAGLEHENLYRDEDSSEMLGDLIEIPSSSSEVNVKILDKSGDVEVVSAVTSEIKSSLKSSEVDKEKILEITNEKLPTFDTNTDKVISEVKVVNASTSQNHGSSKSSVDSIKEQQISKKMLPTVDNNIIKEVVLQSNIHKMIDVPGSRDESSSSELQKPSVDISDDRQETVDNPRVSYRVQSVISSLEESKKEIISKMSAPAELEDLKTSLEAEKKDLSAGIGKLERQATEVTEQIRDEAKELLRLFGIPFVVAPEEAEAQCAYLESINLTDGTVTDDSDIWLFGGRCVYRNFFNNDKRVLQFLSEDIEHHFKLSRKQMIQLALLVGSDYTLGIQGVGPVTALEVLAHFPDEGDDFLRGLSQFASWINAGRTVGPRRTALRTKLKNVQVDRGFPSQAVAQAYLFPTVDESREAFSWGKPNMVRLEDYTKQKFGWTKQKFQEMMQPVLKRMASTKIQKSLLAYFKVKNVDKKSVKESLSKRVQKAVLMLGNEGDEGVDEVPDGENTRKRKGKKSGAENAVGEGEDGGIEGESVRKRKGKKSNEAEAINEGVEGGNGGASEKKPRKRKVKTSDEIAGIIEGADGGIEGALQGVISKRKGKNVGGVGIKKKRLTEVGEVRIEPSCSKAADEVGQDDSVVKPEVSDKVRKVIKCNQVGEVIPQREKDKLEAAQKKQKAIQVFQKSKKPGGKKSKPISRKVKKDAELSESSGDD